MISGPPSTSRSKSAATNIARRAKKTEVLLTSLSVERGTFAVGLRETCIVVVATGASHHGGALEVDAGGGGHRRAGGRGSRGCTTSAAREPARRRPHPHLRRRRRPTPNPTPIPTSTEARRVSKHWWDVVAIEPLGLEARTSGTTVQPRGATAVTECGFLYSVSWDIDKDTGRGTADERIAAARDELSKRDREHRPWGFSRVEVAGFTGYVTAKSAGKGGTLVEFDRLSRRARARPGAAPRCHRAADWKWGTDPVAWLAVLLTTQRAAGAKLALVSSRGPNQRDAEILGRHDPGRPGRLERVVRRGPHERFSVQRRCASFRLRRPRRTPETATHTTRSRRGMAGVRTRDSVRLRPGYPAKIQGARQAPRAGGRAGPSCKAVGSRRRARVVAVPVRDHILRDAVRSARRGASAGSVPARYQRRADARRGAGVVRLPGVTELGREHQPAVGRLVFPGRQAACQNRLRGIGQGARPARSAHRNASQARALGPFEHRQAGGAKLARL